MAGKNTFSNFSLCGGCALQKSSKMDCHKARVSVCISVRIMSVMICLQHPSYYLHN